MFRVVLNRRPLRTVYRTESQSIFVTRKVHYKGTDLCEWKVVERTFDGDWDWGGAGRVEVNRLRTEK